jgi:hypothetical protein
MEAMLDYCRVSGYKLLIYRIIGIIQTRKQITSLRTGGKTKRFANTISSTIRKKEALRKSKENGREV